MTKRLAAVALGFLLALAPGPRAPRAQYPNPAPPTQPETPVPGISQSRPRFSVDASVEPGGGTPTVRLDYRLARSELLFERRPSGYYASYEVRVIFYKDKGGRQVTGDVFVRELTVKSYADTRPVGSDIVDHVEIPAPPDKYEIQVVVKDLVAEKMSGTEIELEIPRQPTGLLWFSDLSFGALKRTGVDGSDLRSRMELNPSRRFSDNIGVLAVFGELVDSRPAASREPTYRIEYRILSEIQDRVLQRDTTIARMEGRTPFLLTPGVSSLAPGTYRFVVELKSPAITTGAGKKSQPIRREKTFDVVQSAASIAADPRSTLDVLRYIATPSELDAMKNLKTDEERRAFWEQFWKQRDPTPETVVNERMEEFYQRVQYANQHFSVGTQGWKTDMGAVYILNGQPDEVVRSPFNFDRPPEEIWYYYRERKTFYFVDKDGFGRYELDRTRTP